MGTPAPVVDRRRETELLEAALRSLATTDLHVQRVEIALRDEADLAHNARRVVQVLDSLEGTAPDVAVHVALPALDADVARRGLVVGACDLTRQLEGVAGVVDDAPSAR